MRVLIFSPIPSDPPNQGNSVRIGRICELFQYFGCTVHFLYHGLEGLNAAQRATMTRRWDYFHFLPYSSSIRQTRLDGYGVDDYYGPEVNAEIKRLQKIWKFDMIFCNYVWMSAALEEVPPDVYKVLDTHDVFGDRQYVLQEQSVAPAWFFTSIPEETRGLNRADLVVAIQDQEQDCLAGRTEKAVTTIGHVLPANFLKGRRRSPSEPIRIGYMASDNPSNRISLRQLVDEVRLRPRLLETFRFMIAGKIGVRLPAGVAGFEAIGYVEDARAFYRSVDIVINPNVSGTGLKIKSVEALSFGVPFVSIADGMIGIETDERAHLCATIPDLVDAVQELADAAALDAARKAARTVFTRYAARQTEAFEDMLSRAKHHRAAHELVPMRTSP